jgi:hypothetical protein
MPNHIPISRENHTGKYWQRFTSYNFAANTRIAPMVSAELAQAVRALPMAFVQQGDNFILCAVMGLDSDQNLYVTPDGKWLGGYVPAAFRGHPFSIQNKTLCIDEDAGLVSEDTRGQALYDNNGELTKPVQDVLNFLQQIEQNRTVTDLAVAALSDAGCITEWQFKDKNVTGLYKADEAKLLNLDDQTYLKLRKTGGIPIAYAQLFSMANIGIFDKLIKIRKQMKKPGIDNCFLNDDMISFE